MRVSQWGPDRQRRALNSCTAGGTTVPGPNQDVMSANMQRALHHTKKSRTAQCDYSDFYLPQLYIMHHASIHVNVAIREHYA